MSEGDYLNAKIASYDSFNRFVNVVGLMNRITNHFRFSNCLNPYFYLDEAKNRLGSNKCTSNCECDGYRTCSPYRWCGGKARNWD